jgi:hypothetical protein
MKPTNKPTADIPPLTYGVWIPAYGWLRDANGRVFADPRREYAATALRMWKIGDKTPARVELIDESMIGLQSIFIERERLHDVSHEFYRTQRPGWRKIWLIGILWLKQLRIRLT